MIPISTTTITILRPPAPTDGWPDTEPVFAVVASAIRAHFSRPEGQETGPAGQRATTQAKLICDPCELTHTDVVQDVNSGLLWQVSWVEPRISGAITDHVVAGVIREMAELESTEATTA